MEKRRVLSVIISITLVVFCVFCGATPVKTAKILLDTPLYKDTDLNGGRVLENIKQNESVSIDGEPFMTADNLWWQKISYSSYTGYVLYDYIYYSADNASYDITIKKATGLSMGEKIPVYDVCGEDGKTVGYLSDGEKVNVISEQNTDYGDYEKIVYDGEFRFVKSVNLTAGLSYNQKLAVIISCGVLGAVLIIVVTALFIHRKKKNKK